MLLYLTIGFLHMFLIDLVRMRIRKLRGREISITHGNRIALILIWPVWAFFFWYNIFRELFRNG